MDISGTHSDAEIWAICDAVQLKATIQAFSSGLALDHPLSFKGRELSQGQLQLLALARAALRRSKIVVLDEATGHLDVETDRIVQEVIREAFRDSTVLTVAHRVGTIADYEQVLIMEQGRVKEIGDPKRLLQIDGSAFARLANAVEARQQ